MAKLRSSLPHLGVAVVLALAFPFPASAQIYVVQSSAPGLKVGSTLNGDSVVALPEGTTVTLMLPSGKTRTLRGRLTRRVSELTSGERIDKALWDKVSDLVKSGGGSESTVGAVRSVAPSRSSGSSPFTLNAVPVDAAGVRCAISGKGLTISRINTSRAYDVTVMDLETRARAVASFAVGATSVDWPKDVGPTDGHRYAFLIEGASMRQFTLRLLSVEPERNLILKSLAERDCSSQLASWIKLLGK